jgi:hypothetical protein
MVYSLINFSLNFFFIKKKACYDPLLDDSVEMAKKLRENNVIIDLKIINSKVSHGFLNLKNFDIDCHEAYNLVTSSFKQIIEGFKNN